MNTKPIQPDAAIDKTLAALNSLTPPEGLESRIAARIAAQPASVPSRWRNLLTGYTLSAAWWRGAATGAAFALLAVTAVLLLQHKPAPRNHLAVTANAPAPIAAPIRVSASPAAPCAHPAILREPHPAPASTPEILRAEIPNESAAPSHPAPALPLTPQERALARLARTANPSQLAALNSENEARLEAQNAAEFKKFFTPPPPPPQPAVNPPANPEPTPAATPEPTPAANPEPTPAANPQHAPEPRPEANPEDNPQPAPSSAPAASN